jgi:hypothetical protein
MKDARAFYLPFLVSCLLLPARIVHCFTTHNDITSRVTPVQKAVQLLESLLSKAKAEKHEEQVQYAGFKQFCDDVTLEKQTALSKADESIESLQAHIQKFDAETERLGMEISKHSSDIGGWTNDSHAAAAVREVELSDYTAMHRNYTESLEALTQAISFMKQQAYDRPAVGSAAAAAAALQLNEKVPLLPREGQRAIAAFLARSSKDPDDTDIGPFEPPADAYKFRSTDIVAMLEKLKEAFKGKKADLESDEVARRHAHITLMQDLKQSVDGAETSISKKTKYQTKAKLDSTNAAAELEDTKATRADDAAYLDELTASCQKKGADFNSRQQLRDEEIVALTKAVELLSGQAVANVTEKHLPKAAAASALLRMNRTASLVQIRQHSQLKLPEADKRERVAALLLAASQRLGSRVLSNIAAEARTSVDPFAKVKLLIEELLQRLLAETGEEAEHKGWCDKELATNEHTRKTKTEEIDILMAETDALDAAIEILKNELNELQTALDDLDADVAKEVEIRTAEKAENEKTITEAKEAQAAVAEAILVLKDFYTKAAKATSFEQQGIAGMHQRQPADAPAIFDDTPYQGLQGESGGVLGMMDVIQSDFVRLERDTATAETTAAAEHEKFMEASAITKTQKETDQKHKEAEKTSKESELLDKRSTLETTQKELAAAQDSYEKLKPACIDTGMTYDDRKTRREEEIEALKEALNILEEM